MKTYSMAEMTAKYDVASSTLRYYEDIGLLRHVPREHGRRYYTDEHIGRLDAITCFKHTGMSMAELQAFFRYEDEGADLGEVIDLLQTHADQLTAHIAEMKTNQAHIRRKLRYYQDIATAEKHGLPAPQWCDYPLAAFTDAGIAAHTPVGAVAKQLG